MMLNEQDTRKSTERVCRGIPSNGGYMWLWDGSSEAHLRMFTLYDKAEALVWAKKRVALSDHVEFCNRAKYRWV
jgi:hypothetical protein